jgi:Arc/MetJ-type ribon-helix-helix transcriptional regulator
MSATVTISAETEQAIQQLIDSGRYHDAGDVIDAAVVFFAAQLTSQQQRLREMVVAGFESGDGGTYGPGFWDEIAREAEEADRQGLPIRREVQP